MSLTQNDLVPGGLYRRKDDPEAIGRLEIGNHNYIEIFMDGKWHGKTRFSSQYWEGISMTKELLQDWFQISVDKINMELGRKIYIRGEQMPFMPSYNNRFYINSWEVDRFRMYMPYVHQLQRLVLALTGKPLEGGPK